jgi:nitrate reductase (cytochrome), electron transfer subunit
MNRNRTTASAAATALLLTAVPLLSSLALAGGLESLRGTMPLDGADLPPIVHQFQERGGFTRSYVQQPPLVPHEVERYQIDLAANQCLSCHSWATHQRERAPKVSRSHFQDREGFDQSDVSARYYFCDQCHVPQTNVQPLVDNQFQPLRMLRAF